MVTCNAVLMFGVFRPASGERELLGARCVALAILGLGIVVGFRFKELKRIGVYGIMIMAAVHLMILVGVNYPNIVWGSVAISGPMVALYAVCLWLGLRNWGDFH